MSVEVSETYDGSFIKVLLTDYKKDEVPNCAAVCEYTAISSLTVNRF